MAQTVIIHLVNEDPILAEVEDLDNLDGPVLECTNPRRRDGKQLHYITPEATSFVPLAPHQLHRVDAQRDGAGRGS
jgi:hypothetical protein